MKKCTRLTGVADILQALDFAMEGDNPARGEVVDHAAPEAV